MNKLDRPQVDDQAALDALANDPRMASYPRLIRHLRALKNGYAQYVAAGGNVSAIRPVALPQITARFLRAHYKAPPKAIAYIAELRRLTEVKTCPMCGSLHSGTLDHLMDKDNHPAFAIYTQNLVPACKCNSKRSNRLTGPNPGERILHPYFDLVLAERILSARFTDLGAVPRVETCIVLDPQDPHFAAAMFHHAEIVVRTGIRSYLSSQWVKLLQRPRTIAMEFRFNPASRANLVEILERERDRHDELRESKNNWDSIFLSGLLEDDVIDWLFERFTQPGRPPDTQLDP